MLGDQVCSDKEFADTFLAVITILVAKFDGLYTAENCRKVKSSVSTIASEWDQVKEK
jgi:hypothetical protein